MRLIEQGELIKGTNGVVEEHHTPDWLMIKISHERGTIDPRHTVPAARMWGARPYAEEL
jgi:hypothetical protein